MSIIFEERASESSFVETVMCGYTVGQGFSIRPAESHWHMVLRKLDGKVDLLVVGPWTRSGQISYTDGAELLWIKLKLGTFMPHLPTRSILDRETVMPDAAGQSFWLGGSTWQFPDYENADTFVNRLAREQVLASDPMVNAVLQNQLLEPELASRTVRHRFLRATGITQSHIRQLERAQLAANLLRQGMPILDTVYEAGYFDQPHLTRSLKQWIGHTPAQIIEAAASTRICSDRPFV
ncbi:MAG TPA: helix-turn-helix domain-containing protein [Ktedonobacteraceae bacterium]